MPKYTCLQFCVPLRHFQQLSLPLQFLNLTEEHYRSQRQRIWIWERGEKEKNMEGDTNISQSFQIFLSISAGFCD